MRLCLGLLVLSVLAGAPAAAQAPASPRPSPDFLFGPPDGSVSVRGSWLFARAGSDWYDFVTDQLTLDASDFNAPGFGLDVAVAIKPRIDVQFGLDFSNAGVTSEYR